MPRLQRFSSSEIAMFFADYLPAHFHVLGREGAAQVRIDTLEVMTLNGKDGLAGGVGLGGPESRVSRREVGGI
jgi:hypothetical protein